MRIKNRKGIEMTFSWMFAIIAGAVILFIAIYAASRIIGTTRFETTTVTAKELSIIFEPLETGIASGKSIKATLSTNTRIYDDCSATTGNFGEQRISLSTLAGRQWSKPSAEIPIDNKYIFSNDTVEGREVNIFGMAFNFPFKVTDTLVMTTNTFCFINAPNFAKEDITNLNLNNIKFDIRNCTDKDIRVCFGSGGTRCAVNVYGTCNFNCESEYDEGYVAKGKQTVYFVGNLIYPAIISSQDIYECNILRLMKKAQQLTLLYRDEATLVSTKCRTVPIGDLANFAQSLALVKSSRDLVQINTIAKGLENQALECELW